jgi:L-lysine 6-transaminase
VLPQGSHPGKSSLHIFKFLQERITTMTNLIMETEKMTQYYTENQITPDSVLSTLRKYMLVDGLDLVIDINKSKGPYLYDSRRNKKYLDLFSFVASNPIGMNHPKMLDENFVNYIGHVALNKPSNSDIYCKEMAEFVQTFFKIAVPPYFKYSFFIEGGGLAVENALKVAFDWKVRKNFKKGYKTEKGQQIIHLKGCFHGRTGYTLSLTNTDQVKTALFPKFNWPRVTAPVVKFPLNENNLDEVIILEKQAIGEIKNALHENKDDIACFIMETIQGEGGDNHFRKEFFEQVRTLCDENEMLFIMDEIQTGIGMTGKWWSHQHFVQPDIIAFGKKTQVCGILSTDRVDDVEDNVFHKSGRLNSTWGGNLVDMVRFKKYLEIIQEENLVNNAKVVGEYLLTKIQDLAEKYPSIISNPRGRGLFCAMDAPTPELRNRLRDKIFDKNVVALGSGEKSIRFRPSLNITKAHIDEGIEVIDECLKQL